MPGAQWACLKAGMTILSSGTVLSAPEHMAVPAFIPLKEKGSLPAAEGSLLM
ncbi:hypothetical protein ACT6QG_04220 [Xanthobacter sp. TB0136]|uniref:hypothetical protein n=1 Tax=Xanthobacter sp. TB0136 TaxID=3459177 RepID=UPI004039D215